MKRILALIAVALLLVMIFPISAMAASVDDIVAGWTPSASGVGANTKAFDFPSLDAASEAAAELVAIGYQETTEGLAETTVLAPDTYAFFDLASFGWGTSCTLYVYVPGGADSAAPAAGGVPGELANAFVVGVWPLPAGQYDPALDGQGIPDGASVYGLFDAAYAVLPIPTSVSGYTEVTDISTLGASNYFVVLGSSGFNYVILGGSGVSSGGAAPAPAAAEPAPVATIDIPEGADPQAVVDQLIATWTPSASGVAGDTKAFEFVDMAAARAAAANLVAIGFSETSDGVAEFTNIAPYTYAFFDLAAFGWGTATTLYVNVAAGEPPLPANFTFWLKDLTDLKITINDAYGKFGYFFLDPAKSDQMQYLFRVKDNGSVSFSKDVQLGIVDNITGDITEWVTVPANTERAIQEINNTRLYLNDGAPNTGANYVQFINEKSTSFYIPPRFATGNDPAVMQASFKNLCDNILEDGKLAPYSLFSGEGGVELMWIVWGGLLVVIPMLAAIIYSQRYEVKSGGVKFAQAKFAED